MELQKKGEKAVEQMPDKRQPFAPSKAAHC
jgi:hypothetical protein